MVRQLGYAGSKSGFRAVISRLRPRRHAAAFLRRSVLAGQEGQVDWAHFGKLMVGRALRDLWALVMVLASRAQSSNAKATRCAFTRRSWRLRGTTASSRGRVRRIGPTRRPTLHSALLSCVAM